MNHTLLFPCCRDRIALNLVARSLIALYRDVHLRKASHNRHRLDKDHDALKFCPFSNVVLDIDG